MEELLDFIKEEWGKAIGTNLEIRLEADEEQETPGVGMGACCLLGRCDWWNPPKEEMRVFGKDASCYCIRCWRWKNKSSKERIKEVLSSDKEKYLK